MIKTLVTFRLIYYKAEIVKKLQRFRLLLFFILAMTVPTIAFMLQIIHSIALGLINETEHSAHFIHITIFQLATLIWIGSQYDCLKISDIENYLRTLKIPRSYFFINELCFFFIISLPFIALLITSIFLLKNSLLLSITHCLYLASSLFFLYVCLTFSRALLIIFLLITNLIFTYFGQFPSGIFLTIILLLLSYFFVTQQNQLLLKPDKITFLPKTCLSRYFPNTHINLKSLFAQNKVYTTCILAFNLLILLVFISYALADKDPKNVVEAFFIAINTIMYLGALLSYKLSETRRDYGLYFHLFYNRINYFFFDLISIYMLMLFYWIAIFLVGLFLTTSLASMVESIMVAAASLVVFMVINRLFNFYGPILSLLCLTGILVTSRGLLQ